jgi:hypothetical protein
MFKKHDRKVLIRALDVNLVEEGEGRREEIEKRDEEVPGRFVQSLQGGSTFIRQP